LIGGSGFIGANIALLANEIGIKTLNLDLYKSSILVGTGAEYLKFDLNMPANFNTINSFITKSVDLVILATPIIIDSKKNRETPDNPIFTQTNTITGQINSYYENIYKFILTNSSKIRKIIYVSSFDVYGSLNRLSVNINKKTTPNPDSSYALSKYAGEISTTLAARTVGCQISILRLSQVFGPGESTRYTRLIPKLLKGFSHGEHLELNPLRDCTRQYVSTYQVFAHVLDILLESNTEYDLRNVVGKKTKFVDIVKMCNEVCDLGTYVIKPMSEIDWYRANIEIDYPSFLADTFNENYTEHFRSTLKEELQYMSRDLQNLE